MILGDVSKGENGIVQGVVLYDEEYNKKNNTNYGIQILTSIEENISMGYDMIPGEGSEFERGKNVYNNAIEILNSKAEKYLNEKYAKDARCLGSVPDNKNYESGFYTREDKWFADFNNTFKDTDNNYEIDYTQMEKMKLSQYATGPIASRVVESNDKEVRFKLRYKEADRIYEIGMGGLRLVYYDEEGEIETEDPESSVDIYRFSPIFTLKEEIKITNGDGKDTPYTLKAE